MVYSLSVLLAVGLAVASTSYALPILQSLPLGPGPVVFNGTLIPAFNPSRPANGAASVKPLLNSTHILPLEDCGFGGDISSSVAGGAANAAVTQGIQAIGSLFNRELEARGFGGDVASSVAGGAANAAVTRLFNASGVFSTNVRGHSEMRLYSSLGNLE